MSKQSFPMSALAIALVSIGFGLAAHAQTATSSDHQFADNAAIAGMAEVAAGNLAERQGQDVQVKQFAQRMIHDHTQANDRLKQVAAAQRIALPTKLDKHAQQELDKMEKLSGDEFDRAYIKAQVADHKKVIEEFEKEANGGKDHELVGFAQTTLPTLREHLSAAQAAEHEVMAKSASNMKKENAKNLAAARAGTGATRAEALKEDRMPVPKTGM